MRLANRNRRCTLISVLFVGVSLDATATERSIGRRTIRRWW